MGGFYATSLSIFFAIICTNTSLSVVDLNQMKASEKYWLTGAFLAASCGTSLIIASEIRDARYLHQTLVQISDKADVAEQSLKIVDKTPVSYEQVVMLMPVADYSDSEEEPKKKKILADYPGFGKDPFSGTSGFDKEEQQREVFIANCMAAKGYDYVPTPSKATLHDPNEAYVESLGMTERDYYYTALLGMVDPGAVAKNQYQDFASGGCVVEASRLIPDIYAIKKSIGNEYNNMETVVDTDFGTAEARIVWARCMRGNGYDFESPEAVFEEISSYYIEQTEVNQAINDEYYQSVITSSESCEELIALTRDELIS